MSDVDSDDDELVATTDLLLAQPPAGKELFVLDYPSRSPAAPSLAAERAVEGVRLRPGHRRLELSVSLFPRTPDGRDSAASFDFDRPRGCERYGEEGDCQRFMSAQASEPTSNFAAATYVRPEGAGDGYGAVVLVPVQKVTKMRPRFDYLDRVDRELQLEKAMVKAENEKEKGTLEAGEGAEKEEGGGGEVRVELQYQKRESERAAERRKMSYAHLMKIEEEDPWVALDFVDQSNPQISDCRKEMFRTAPVASEFETEAGMLGNNTVKKEDAFPDTGTGRTHRDRDGDRGGNREGQRETPDESFEGKSYIDMFFEHAPGANPLAAALLRLGEATVPMGSVRALRLEKPEIAVRKLLNSARVVRMSVLRECVPDSVSEEELMKEVRKAAFLMRGCWVFNTPRKRSRRHVGKRMPARVVAARVLVLAIFRESDAISMEDVFRIAFSGVVPPDVETITDVLTEVAEYESGVGWLFRLRGSGEAADVVSADIVADEELAWDDRLEEARKVMASVSAVRTEDGTSGAGGGGRGPPRPRGR